MEIEKQILDSSNVVAIVGISPNPDRPSHIVGDYLQEHGYRVIPVNPNVEEILGEKCYPELSAVTEKIDVVDIFRRSEDVIPIVEEAIEVGGEIQSERDRLSGIFDIKLVPSIEELVLIRKVLRQYRAKKLAFLHSDYRKAKKALSGFLRKNSTLKDTGVVDELETLEAMITASENYSNNSTYQKALGHLFNGLDTNIDTLKEVHSWSTQLYATTNFVPVSAEAEMYVADAVKVYSDPKPITVPVTPPATAVPLPASL